MKVHCSQCGEVDINEDMGFWCDECGDRIEESDILSSLMVEFEKLHKRVQALEANRS